MADEIIVNEAPEAAEPPTVVVVNAAEPSDSEPLDALVEIASRLGALEEKVIELDGRTYEAEVTAQTAVMEARIAEDEVIEVADEEIAAEVIAEVVAEEKAAEVAEVVVKEEVEEERPKNDHWWFRGRH